MTVPSTTPTISPAPAVPLPSAPAVLPPSEVLHSEHHSRLTVEDIAKAVARHQREHPGAARNARPQKTTPRH